MATDGSTAQTVRIPTTTSALVADLSMFALREADLDGLCRTACERLASNIGATVTLLEVNGSGELVVRASSSDEPRDPAAMMDDPELMVVPVADGAAARRLVIDPAPSSPTVMADIRAVADVLEAAGRRIRIDHSVRSSEERLRMAQQLANLGSYDWEIATDTNRWSDELYRIYGCEPQSFNASYEKFMSFIHPDDQEQVRAIHAAAFETLEPYEMEERIVRPDGEERILKSNGVVIADERGNPARMAGICWDITELKRAEEDRVKLRDMGTARAQALTINDNIVQGLVSALGHLRLGDDSETELFLTETLAAARRMMDDLLDQTFGLGGLKPGDLLRPEPATLDTERERRQAQEAQTTREPQRTDITVLVADDTPAMRRLTRHILKDVTNVVVVGEAADGREAIDLATSLTPDVIILDLAMPELDGLSAIPQLRECSPLTRILVMTGYGEEVGRQATSLGAHAYLEKGSPMEDLRSEVLRLASSF
jgi:PAS domain S-box-containing protein